MVAGATPRKFIRKNSPKSSRDVPAAQNLDIFWRGIGLTFVVPGVYVGTSGSCGLRCSLAWSRIFREKDQVF